MSSLCLCLCVCERQEPGCHISLLELVVVSFNGVGVVAAVAVHLCRCCRHPDTHKGGWCGENGFFNL